MPQFQLDKEIQNAIVDADGQVSQYTIEKAVALMFYLAIRETHQEELQRICETAIRQVDIESLVRELVSDYISENICIDITC
jgi:hypothetical protein